MKTGRNGKGQAKGNQGSGSRNFGPGLDTFWKCTGFKGCCYFRWNSMEESECFACGEPVHTTPQGETSPHSADDTTHDTRSGGSGNGKRFRKSSDERDTLPPRRQEPGGTDLSPQATPGTTNLVSHGTRLPRGPTTDHPLTGHPTCNSQEGETLRRTKAKGKASPGGPGTHSRTEQAR
jgi:hypothetical protein